jgi:hypothetical protein
MDNGCNAFLMLGRDPMWSGATEDDFLGWVAFAAARLSRVSHLKVHVDVRNRTDSLQRNLLVTLDTADSPLLHDALQHVWDLWVSMGSPCVDMGREYTYDNAYDDDETPTWPGTGPIPARSAT